MDKLISTNDLHLYNFKHMNYILFQSRACSWPQIYPTAYNTISILKFFNCTNSMFQKFNCSSSPFKFPLSPEFPLFVNAVTIQGPSNMKSVLLLNFFLTLLLFNQQWRFIEYCHWPLVLAPQDQMIFIIGPCNPQICARSNLRVSSKLQRNMSYTSISWVILRDFKMRSRAKMWGDVGRKINKK